MEKPMDTFTETKLVNHQLKTKLMDGAPPTPPQKKVFVTCIVFRSFAYGLF